MLTYYTLFVWAIWLGKLLYLSFLSNAIMLYMHVYFNVHVHVHVLL